MMKKQILILQILLIVFFGTYVTQIYAGQILYSNLTNSDSSRNYDIKFYHINLEISKSSSLIQGSVLIRSEALTNSSFLEFDLDNQLLVDSVLLDNKLIDFKRDTQNITLLPANPLVKHSFFNVQFFYRGDAYSKSSNGGIFNRLSSFETPVTFTLSEPFSTKAWIPCKQDLSDKADSVYMYITAPDSMLVGAIGLLSRIVSIDNGTRRFEWKSHYPISYYLISFSAGYYRDYTFSVDFKDSDLSIPVINYIYDDDKYFSNTQIAIDKTADLIHCYNNFFGIYPFNKEKYGHCTAPMGGGMEHQTMTTLADFGFNLVAHELAHQWFGNNVSCSNWQDIWINEGFASYAEYIAAENMGMPGDAQNWLAEAQGWVKREPDGSVYVPLDEINNADRIFDYRLSYQKGAYLIHMIRHFVRNDSLFFQVLKSFQQKFAYGVASAEDFKLLLEEISGQSFSSFFDEWYYGEGYPEFEVSWKTKNDSLYIVTIQKPTAPEITPFFHLPIDFHIHYLEKDTIVTGFQDALIDTFAFYIPERIISLTTDPNNWILKTILYEKEFVEPDLVEPPFLVYPNPAKDQLIIESIDELEVFQVMIYTNEGRLFFNSKQGKHYIKINTTGFPSGAYVIKIITRDGSTSSCKFIKTN